MQIEFTAKEIAESICKDHIRLYKQVDIEKANCFGVRVKYDTTNRVILFSFVARENAEVNIGLAIDAFAADPTQAIKMFHSAIQESIEVYLKAKQENESIIITTPNAATIEEAVGKTFH